MYMTDFIKTLPNSTGNFRSRNVCHFGDVKTCVSGVPTMSVDGSNYHGTGNFNAVLEKLD